jgi:hypothetical protein
MIRHILAILFFALSSGLFGQKQVSLSPVSSAHKPDSIKKQRILKQWNLSADYSEEINIPFDTVFSLFNRFKIADRYSPVNASLGNYGLPFYQINFFDRITDPDKFLYSYYYPLMHLPDRAIFMNTQIPFTELIWTFAGPRETSEQTFRVRHSQNINRFLNFGLIYDIIYSLGQYNYQRSEDKTFTLYSSYTGVRYKLYFSAGINNLVSYENGGITDVTQLGQITPRDINLNLGGLNKAKSLLKNRDLLLVQRYTFGSILREKKDTVSQKRTGFLGLSGTFSHIFVLENNKRTYTDSYPKAGFYDTAYISNTNTFDSLYSKTVRNTLRFDFTTDATRKFSLGGGVGLRSEIFHYSQIIPTHDSTLADTAVWNRSNIVLIGKLLNNIGDKFRWIATGELYMTGYRAGDFNLNGEITKSFKWKRGSAFWLITGGIANRQPSFWFQQWGSNNFEWHNNFSKEFRVDVGSSFSYPARKAEIKFNYAIIKNYTDFDTTALPSQYSGGLSVAAITIRKELRAWKFHLATDVIIQKSSNINLLDLPLATVRSAGFFEHLFKFNKTGGRLNIQLGADVTYNTLYHPYSYMPATGRFFRQDKFSAGNYPFINAFLNFKIKRTRVFVMFDHVNSGMMGTNYEMAPNYPMNIRMLRYGLAWTFYD